VGFPRTVATKRAAAKRRSNKRSTEDAAGFMAVVRGERRPYEHGR
jgi:hypothetical protein